MDIIKLVDRDIASVKERIDTENSNGHYEYEFDGETYKTADEVLEAVVEWEALDCNLSYDAGYVAGLENLKFYYEHYSYKHKLKSLLAKVKLVFAKKNRNNISLDLNE